MLIFVLRHADRSPNMADGLSAAGVKRAKTLAHMLATSGVSVAYCSDALRTHETLAPLKQVLGNGLALTEVSAKGPGGSDDYVRVIVKAIKALPTTTIAVVVSHSNTVGPIITGLGGGNIDPIADTEFDKLFLVFSPTVGPKTLLLMRY